MGQSCEVHDVLNIFVVKLASIHRHRPRLHFPDTLAASGAPGQWTVEGSDLHHSLQNSPFPVCQPGEEWRVSEKGRGATNGKGLGSGWPRVQRNRQHQHWAVEQGSGNDLLLPEAPETRGLPVTAAGIPCSDECGVRTVAIPAASPSSLLKPRCELSALLCSGNTRREGGPGRVTKGTECLEETKSFNSDTRSTAQRWRSKMLERTCGSTPKLNLSCVCLEIKPEQQGALLQSPKQGQIRKRETVAWCRKGATSHAKLSFIGSRNTQHFFVRG